MTEQTTTNYQPSHLNFFQLIEDKFPQGSLTFLPKNPLNTEQLKKSPSRVIQFDCI